MYVVKKPFDIGLIIYRPDRDVAGFHIEFSPESLYKPGVLFEAIKVFSEYNISILHIAVSRPTQNKPIDIVIFTDLTGKLDLKDEIAEKLHKIREVENVHVINQAYKGLAGCITFFPLIFLGDRCIILRKPGYKALIRALEKRYGSALSTILFEIGFEMRGEYFEDHSRYFGKSLDLLIKSLYLFAPTVGFGLIKDVYINLEKREISVQIYDNFECKLFLGSGKPSSNFVRGIFSGWCSKLFGEKIVLLETKCIAKGDPYCEFIKSK